MATAATLTNTIARWVEANTRPGCDHGFSRILTNTQTARFRAGHTSPSGIPWAAVYQINGQFLVVDRTAAWHLARWADATDTDLECVFTWGEPTPHIHNLEYWDTGHGRYIVWTSATSSAVPVPTEARSAANNRLIGRPRIEFNPEPVAA